MRLTVVICIFLACAVVALAEEAEEARPRRHLHQIKKMIVNKLFTSSEPNCTQFTEAPALPPLETKFFRIPGFNNVVIKAVPKGTSEPAPIDEKLPPNSHIGIVGSYLGTSTLNETYNALIGVKNLLSSGILSAKRDMLHELSLAHPPKVQIIAAVPSKPCASPLPLEPVRILVKPPKVPVVPTQYSYKQVNQDGSVTTHTSSLDLDNGVRVTEDGKTLPFIIDRVRKIPVHLPVPILPEVSKIIVSQVAQPVSTYTYQQIHQDGRMTSYMGLPSMISQPGPVVVTETGNRIPPPPVFLMDRIEKVAAIASFPRSPIIDIAAKPVIEHAHYAPSGTVINAPLGPGKPLLAPGPSGYSYSQINVNDGMATHTGSGVNGSVLVTENRLPTGPLNGSPSLSEQNPFRHPASSGGFSYSQVNSGGKMTSYNGLGDQPGLVSVLEHRPLPPASVLPVVSRPPNSFSYKQIGEGKMTTYTGSGMFEESIGGRPTVVVHGVNHPVPPPHITDRIEKVAAGAKFNQPPYSTMPIANPVAVPERHVFVPPVHTSVPQRPVKTPTTSGMSSFVYKQIHNDGSVLRYGADGLNVEDGKRQLPPPANMEKPFPQGNVRAFDSSMYNGPFPMDPVNPNTVKPSTPVSGSYSYKMVNSNMPVSQPPARPVNEPIVDTFAAPFTSLPVPIEGCINPDIVGNGRIGPVVGDIENTFVDVNPVLIEKPVPMTYSYKQISHSNSNPFLVVNVEDPITDVKKVNMNLSFSNQAYQPLPPPPPPASLFPDVSVTEHKPAFVQPAPFVPAPVATMPVSQVPVEISPPPSFSYKQVISQALPLPPPQPAVDVIEHRPSAPVPPPMINMRVPQVQAPPSSFSYKQVTHQGLFEYSDEFPTEVKTNLPPSALKNQGNPSGNVYVEQKPLLNSRMPMPVPAIPVPIPASPLPVPVHPRPVLVHPMPMPPSPMPIPPSPMPMPPSPMSVAPSPMPGIVHPMPFPPSPMPGIVHPMPMPPSRMPVPPSPMPAIVHPMPISPSPMPVRPSPMPVIAHPMPVPSPIPTLNNRNSLANNPIIVPEQSSFSFKSSNPDGSTITVKDDGHNSILVHVEESPRTEESQDEASSIPAETNEPSVAESEKVTMTTSVSEETPGPISGHARPSHRRVLKRKRPVKHRGDIPDASE